MTTQTLTREPGRTRRGLRGLTSRKAGALALMAALGTLAIQAYRGCWVEQAYGHLHNDWVGNTAPARNIWLPDFKVAVDAKVVESTLRNLSGITYDHDSDRLLAVTNGSPAELLVLSKAGDIEARYPMEGFQDPEALTYVGNNRFVIAEERRQRLAMFTLPDTEQLISAKQAQTITLSLNPTHNNKGLEGLTYDARHDRLIAIKERDPKQMFAVSGLMRSVQGPVNIAVTDLTSWVERSRYASDLSDGYYDPRTGHLLLLSDQSKNITELDDDGNFVSIQSLRAGSGGLAKNAPQAEGITMDDEGNLYAVSEPNLFYRFEKP